MAGSPNLAALAVAAGRVQGSRDVVDPLTFIEAPWGLKMSLRPVQKVILKAYYGIPLDDTTPTVRVMDSWRGDNTRLITEAAYLRKLFAEGRCNISEVTPGKARKELVLSIGRRSGKCVVGDTLVLTDQGLQEIISLGDPNGPEHQPLDIGVAQEGGGRSRTAYFYNGGEREVRRLETRGGFRLGGTPNHRIKVMAPEGKVVWKYLEDLEVGDWVCVDRKAGLWAANPLDCKPYWEDLDASLIREWQPPTVLDERYGLLLGLLAGDGTWTAQDRIAMTIEHPETWAFCKGLFMGLFGGYGVYMDKRTDNTGTLYYAGRGPRRFLHRLGWNWDVNKTTKRVPWAVFRSPRPVVCAFLRGLFETDGGVEHSGATVSFTAASRQMCQDVQTLLLNMGIVSKIRHKKAEDAWCLRLFGRESRELFARDIGFLSQKKQGPLLEYLQKDPQDRDVIPHQEEWLDRVLAESRKAKCARHLPQIPGALVRSRLTQLVEAMQEHLPQSPCLAHFQDLQKVDYFYDPVSEIEEGVEAVFDLNVPDGAQFVANGLINHNTTLSACIAAYETYKLISKGDPQSYYGVSHSNTIQLISVATDKDQAGLLYQEVSGHFKGCDFFSAYTANNTQSYAKFQTPKDIERSGTYASDQGAKASLKVTFRSCVAKGLRGAGNIVVILDEVAHFTDKGQASADAVWSAVVPSTLAYTPKDPEDLNLPIGPNEAKVIAISSPLGKQGMFYVLFSDGFKPGVSDSRLCIQAPTWEVNPTVDAAALLPDFIKDARVFFTEYGAEFSDRTRGWLENPKDLFALIDPNARPRYRGVVRAPYTAGLDVALVGDWTTIALGHLDDKRRVQVDLVDGIKAGEGQYADAERLDFSLDVAPWVASWTKKFYITEGIFDQWLGIPLEQALQAQGLRQFKAVKFNPQLNSQVYQNFKDMMYDNRLVLYDYPALEGMDHCRYIQELLELQATYVSRYVTEVEAPRIAGKHDDHADALVRMVWLISQSLGKIASIAGVRKHGTGSPQAQGAQARSSLVSEMAARRKALQGGSDPNRQRPQANGRRRGGLDRSPLGSPPWKKGGR